MFRGYHDVNFRLVLQPSESLTEAGFIPINGTLEDLKREIDQGYSDGVAAITKLLESEERNTNLGEDVIDFMLHK